MAAGKKAKKRVLKQIRLKKDDVTFDAHGWMVIKNPDIQKLIEVRMLASGVIPRTNIACPMPPAPPPSPDAMCACAFITIGQDLRQVRTVERGSVQVRTRPLRAQQPRTVQTRGTQRTPEL